MKIPVRFHLHFADAVKILLLGLICVDGSQALAQEFNSHGEKWFDDEDYRAYRLIVQKKDLSSIDQAFALREPNLLFEIYSKAEGNKYGAPNTDPMLADVAAIASDQERRHLNLEVKEQALLRLRQLPGLARYLGNQIESTVDGPGGFPDRWMYIRRLSILANDDSVVQLGRFLFDDRNPDAKDPAHPVMYEQSAIKHYISSALIGVLREMPGVAAEIKATPKGDPRKYERVKNWWLKSPEAAPYRRQLADLGVELPPGYPPLAELQGAKSVIRGTKTSVQLSESPASSGASQSDSRQSVWLTVCVALVILVVLLTFRRK